MARSRRVSAKDCINWIEDYCLVPEGAHIGRKVVLRPFQRAEMRRIYDNKHGTRRAIISFGRKNGKTTFAACLLLLHLIGPKSKYNSHLYSAAQARKQAALLFDYAAKMVRMNPVLARLIIIRDNAKQLVCPKRGTVYEAMSAEASTAYGLSPVFVVHDELGQVRGPRSELYDALETATGAQENPLSIVISTQAPKDDDLLSMLIDDAQTGGDPHTVCSLYTAPPDDDPFAVETIKKANPAFGDFLSKKEVQSMAEDARRMPAKEASFRNLILNQRVETEGQPFISKDAWFSCAAEPVQFGDLPVWGALDLSTSKDLTALVLIAERAGVWQVRPTFWFPRDGLEERARTEHAPYDVWRLAGHLQTTPGPVIAYDFLAQHIRDVFARYNVQKIAFDDWNFEMLKAAMHRVGIPDAVVADKFVQFRQGFKSMSPALRTLEELVLSKRLAHGGHPVLSMCADNSVVVSDDAGNRKLTKRKSHWHIDGMVALTMAVHTAVAGQAEQRPEYQMFFV